MRNYQIYDLCVNSDFDLPADSCIQAAYQPGRTLCLSYKPEAFHEFAQVQWISSRNGGMLRSYDIANGVLICAGNDAQEGASFFVSREGSAIVSNSDRLEVSLLLSNLGLSISTLLAGHLPMHAAAVRIDGKFVGISAPSGTGKTTLLWELLDAGARFASDDVFHIFTQDNKAVAVASVSLHAKLSEAALQRRDSDRSQYMETFKGSEEYWVPVASEHRVLEKHPLDALFILQPVAQSSDVNAVDAQRVRGGAAVSLLMKNTQALWAVYPLLDGKRLFNIYALLAESVPIYVLRYVRRYEILPQLVEAIRTHAELSK